MSITTTHPKDNPARGLTTPLSDVKNVQMVFQSIPFTSFRDRITTCALHLLSGRIDPTLSPWRCPTIFLLTSQQNMPIFELRSRHTVGTSSRGWFSLSYVPRLLVRASQAIQQPFLFSPLSPFSKQKSPPTPSLSGRHTRDISPSEKRELPFSQTAYAKPLTPPPKALHPLLTSLRTKAPQ